MVAATLVDLRTTGNVKSFMNLVLRSLRSRRLEGRPRGTALGAILRDARKCALLRMRA
jgi:hypothetical protein